MMASLVYNVNSSRAKTIQRNPASKQTNTKPTKTRKQQKKTKEMVKLLKDNISLVSILEFDEQDLLIGRT